jgi:hypothetical protein
MPLSAPAREFVRVRLLSLIQLDTALLLQSDVDVWWSAERLAQQLRVSVEAARHALEELGARNLLDVRIANDLTYRFAPWHESAAQLMGEVAENHYEAREIVARGGTAAARFAEAFKVRKHDG